MGKTYRKEKGHCGFFEETSDYFYEKHTTSKNKRRKKSLSPHNDYETDEDHVFIEKMRKRK